MGDQIARTAGRTSNDMTLSPSERNDRWLTPMPIIDALSVEWDSFKFDLDPCGAPDHETAYKVFRLEDGKDGLRDSWVLPFKDHPFIPRVWMNPPYGKDLRQWVDKFVMLYEAERITGTMLIPVATGTKVWQEVILPKASAIMYWKHRINFQSRDDTTGKGMVSVQASALVAFGKPDTEALVDAVQRRALPGTVTTYTN